MATNMVTTEIKKILTFSSPILAVTALHLHLLLLQVVAHSSQMIYTRMIGDATEDEKKEEEKGGVVKPDKKGKKVGTFRILGLFS